MWVKFKQVLSRLTGISTPVFGVSWDPSEPAVAAARRLLTYLEDRRVLYVPSELEVPHHCVSSVLEIRRFLTDLLGAEDYGAEFTDAVRAMRAACRKFLRVADELEGTHGWFGDRFNPGHFATWRFDIALGEMRGVFGIHVAQIVAKYGLDIEDELATILPGEDGDDQGRPRRSQRDR